MKRYFKYVLCLFFLTLGAPLSFAQYFYIPYYGKNKVQYSQFNWKSYNTEHFTIYHYVEDIKTLKAVAEMAESAYQKISHDLKHALTVPVPLIYYKTLTDFEQTNVFPGVGEGVLGVSEPLLHRIGVYGDLPPDEMQNIIAHELTHVFQFDLLWGSPGGRIYSLSAPPDWVMEGYCEFNTGSWDPWSILIVRDATLNDRIPELDEDGRLSIRYPYPRPPAYDFGHAMFEFIDSKFGKNGIREFWHSLKRFPFMGRRNPIQKSFNISYKQFNYEFKKYLRDRFKDFVARENPENYSIPIGPEFPLNPYYFSISHALSPSGDIVAVITQNYKAYDIDILLVSTKDGSVIKNITKGYTTKYEYVRFDIDPSKGKDLVWSPDGDSIAFFGRSGEKYALFMINPANGKTVRKIPIPYDQPSSPCILPGGEEMLFTAFHEGQHDIFRLNLATENFQNLTEDDLFEKAPTVSPDGQYVAYSIRLDAYDKLFLSPLDDLKKKTQLTFGKGNTISPHFSPDSREIFFSGDTRDAYNIYSISLEGGELKRYTDVRTGNFFPIPHPTQPDTIIFSSFNKGALQLFQSELEGEPLMTVAFVEKEPDEEYERFEPVVTVEIEKDKIQVHKGMSKLYLLGRPPVDTMVSTDGSLYGGSALSFSDILGDYSLNVMAYQVRSFRSYQFSFINRKKRFQYMASAFQYTLFYYLSTYYDPLLYDLYSYRDATATRKITGINFSTYYPFNRFYRFQGSLGFYNYEENYLAFYGGGYGGFWNGNIVSADVSLIGETTRFKYPYGPVSGNTFRLSLSQAIPVSSSFLQNTTAEADLRQYLYLGADALFAARFNGFASRGKNPFVSYWGGNNQVRSAEYYSIVGSEGWYANLEFRFPLVNIASTLIGTIGPVRGTLFFDVTRSKISGYPAKFWTLTGYDAFGFPILREAEAIGSIGYGFQFFIFGLPLHLDLAKRIEWQNFSKPFDFESYGKFRVRFWIGYDF